MPRATFCSNCRMRGGVEFEQDYPYGWFPGKFPVREGEL